MRGWPLFFDPPKNPTFVKGFPNRCILLRAAPVYVVVMNVRTSLRPVSLLALALLFASLLAAQETLDRIVAVIGDEVILQSDVDNQYTYLIINGQKDDGGMRCQIFEELIIQKLLLNKARQDSITVTAGEIDNEINRRVATITDNIGVAEFESIYKKSIPEFKADIRQDVENELLIDRMRSQVSTDATITPREVKQYYQSLPKDSLGLMPAEVQVNQIVLIPPFSAESKKQARETLEGLRKRVINGEGFGELAKKYSDDPGSKRQNGMLGEFTPGMMVKAFDDVVFSMREGEVSDVFESEYGYHIIMLHKRQGQVVTASHILKVPSRSVDGDSTAIDSLGRIRARIVADSLTFEQAAIRYSEDRATKDCGGCISNPKTGDLRIPMDLLDSDLFFKVDEMKPGEISQAMEYRMPDGTRAFHLLYLHKKIPPHEPNLEDDYKKIHTAALQAKQAELFEKWLIQAKENIFIDIKPTECGNALRPWLKQ